MVAFNFPHIGLGIKVNNFLPLDSIGRTFCFSSTCYAHATPRQDEAVNAQKNRDLLFRFFRCAVAVLDFTRQSTGRPPRVVVTLKRGAPYETLWKVKEVAQLATDGMLQLHQVLPFVPAHFPGYAHRRTIGFKPGLSKRDNEELSKGARSYVFHAALSIA